MEPETRNVEKENVRNKNTSRIKDIIAYPERKIK